MEGCERVEMREECQKGVRKVGIARAECWGYAVNPDFQALKECGIVHAVRHLILVL